MSRQVTRACSLSIQNSAATALLQQTITIPEHNTLLNTVRVIATRYHLKAALRLFYSAPPLLHPRQIYATLFHACARHGFFQEGFDLHHHMLCHEPNKPPGLVVTNHLINFYAKCGHLAYARKLFDEMPRRNVVSWTALISGYAQHGEAHECFRVFSDMLACCRPNEFAVSSVLASCEYAAGKMVHCLVSKMGLDRSVYVGNALIAMYNRNNSDVGWTVFETMEFRDIVTWNSMIAGLSDGARAVSVFRQMLCDGIGFDDTTLLSVFSLLSENSNDKIDASRKFCFQLHCLGIKSGCVLKVEVVTALVKAYSVLQGETADCYKLFLDTSCRDIVSWTVIITVFAESEPEEAIFLFCKLRQEDLSPDRFTFSIMIKACAGMVTERHALTVHSQIIKAGFDDDTVLANALINAYARCGAISLSKKVFDEMKIHDLISWNSMLKAYALHGQGKEALHLFSKMDIHPDSATMTALLSACSHTGLVEEGIKIFDSMFANHGIHPQLDHYACIVDILGRAGRLFEAENLIKKMPMEPDWVIWSALLCSCRKHGETQLANLAAERMKDLDPGNSLGYVQMSNIYCSRGSYGEAGFIRKEMKGSGIRKVPGLSWIEIGNKVHEFASGGRCHPQREVICTKLEALIGQLKEIGYVPETNLALLDIEEEHKEEQIYHHSEKLALVFAMMNEDSLHSGTTTTIRIMKNIRICVDCHNFMKLTSGLLQKEIVVRDSNRFHHFKDGMCSCSDYW